MNLRYRILTTLLSVIALVTVLSVNVLAQDGPIELVFRQLDAENLTLGLVQAVANWNAENPNIQVRLETGSASEGLAQYTREVQAGGGPDILHSAFVWTRDLARAGQALNLDPFIESAPPGAGIDDFIALDLATFEGSVYGIPWTVDTFTPVYNQRLFEEAGITEFPDTWDELFTVAQQLTKDTDGDGRIDQFGYAFPAGGEASSGIWFLANYYLWSSGKYLVQPSEANPEQWEVGVTAEDVAGVLNYFNQFIEAGVTPESLLAVLSFSDAEIVSGVANGEFAITIVPPQAFRAIQSNATEPLTTTVVPQGSETRISHLGGRTLVINPNSPHPDEAWQFIEYLLTSEFFELHQGYYPAQNALFDQIEFPEAEQGYVEQIPLAITFAVYIDSPAPVSGLQRAVTREFSAYFSGQKTVEQASADLVIALESLVTTGAE